MFLRLLILCCPVVASGAASGSTPSGKEGGFLAGSGGTGMVGNLPEAVGNLPNEMLASIMMMSHDITRPLRPMQHASRQFSGVVPREAVILHRLEALRQLDDTDPDVRSNAITTLFTISKKDDAEVIAAVSRRLMKVSGENPHLCTDGDLLVRAEAAAARALVSLTDADLSVRAEAVRALVSLTAETNRDLLASTISELLVVSTAVPVPYERFFLMHPLLFAPGSPIRIHPGAADLERMLTRPLVWNGANLAPFFPRFPTNGGEIPLIATYAEQWSRSTAGSSRMFLNMLNSLFPAELQAAINEQRAQLSFQREFLVPVGTIQDVDGLITQIEGAEVAFQEQAVQQGGVVVGYPPFYGFSLLDTQRSYQGEPSEQSVQIVGKWVHTRGYGLWIEIDGLWIEIS